MEASRRINVASTGSAFPSNEAAAVSIYVSRKADVAGLDEFIGPKR